VAERVDLDEGELRAVASGEGHRLVIRGATRIRNAAVRFAPRGRTGDLKRSIRLRITREPDGDTTAEVYSTASYARFVHDGTRPHRIEPRRRGGVLRFPMVGAPGGIVFARSVNHPGTKANPFLTKALDAVASTAGFARER
jgi:HK97 gp10 family phage protein